MSDRPGRLLRLLLLVQRWNPPGLGALQVVNAWWVSMQWRLRGFEPPAFSREGVLTLRERHDSFFRRSEGNLFVSI